MIRLRFLIPASLIGFMMATPAFGGLYAPSEPAGSGLNMTGAIPVIDTGAVTTAANGMPSTPGNTEPSTTPPGMPNSAMPNNPPNNNGVGIGSTGSYVGTSAPMEMRPTGAPVGSTVPGTNPPQRPRY